MAYNYPKLLMIVSAGRRECFYYGFILSNTCGDCMTGWERVKESKLHGKFGGQWEIKSLTPEIGS